MRGKHPRAKGKLGDILAFAREAVNGPKIEHLSLCVIDGKERLPDTWRTLVLSSHTEFERTFGHQAKKKRKLYNGMIKCDLFIYDPSHRR